jgi:hypothetical protein
MSTITYERIENQAAPMSQDGLIVVLYSVVAIAVLVGLHSLSDPVRDRPAGFELASTLY